MIALTPDQLATIHVNMDSIRKIYPKPRLDSISNGADDDGSGSMARARDRRGDSVDEGEAEALDAVRVAHGRRSRDSSGSRFFTRNPTVPMDSVVAQINIDMIGRGRAEDLPGGGPDYLGVVGSFFDSKDLGETVAAVNKKQTKPLALDYRVRHDAHVDGLQQHLRPQRPLQLRAAGRADRVLLHGSARRLPPAHGRAGVHRLSALRADRELHPRYHGRSREWSASADERHQPRASPEASHAMIASVSSASLRRGTRRPRARSARRRPRSRTHAQGAGSDAGDGDGAEGSRRSKPMPTTLTVHVGETVSLGRITVTVIDSSGTHGRFADWLRFRDQAGRARDRDAASSHRRAPGNDRARDPLSSLRMDRAEGSTSGDEGQGCRGEVSQGYHGPARTQTDGHGNGDIAF